MPTDRVFRFSISGMMFFICYIFFSLFFGTKPSEIFNVEFGNEKFIALIVLILSTPIIGTIISTIGLWISFKRKGYRVFYYLPENVETVRYILKDYPLLKDRVIVNNQLDWKDKNNVREFYPHYQAIVKDCIDGEKLQFLERRWSTHLTHINNNWAILFALLITLLLRLFNGGGFYNMQLDTEAYKIIGCVIIIAYCVTSKFHSKISRDDATKFEHILLDKAVEQRIRNEKKELTINRELTIDKTNDWTSLLIKILQKLF